METPEVEKGEVLEEFELDGKPAQLIRLKPGDIDEEDLTKLVENLTATNFKLLDIAHSGERMAVRDVVLKTREKLKGVPVIGSAIFNSRIWDAVTGKLYPDHTRQEHLKGYKEKSYPGLMEKGHLLGVKVDGRVIALQGYRKMGDSASGRGVYEFIKASTMSVYRRNGLATRMKKLIYAEIMGEDPNAMYVSATINPKHLETFRRRGWHVVEMDDLNEAVQVMFQKDPEYATHMKSQGYKAVYLDPKVDKVRWD